jgi:hypothetical protein
MTGALQKIVKRLGRLPAEKQDFIASVIEDELAADRKWDETFATEASQKLLAKMGEEAIREYDKGATTPLFEGLNHRRAKRSRRKAAPGQQRKMSRKTRANA